jgi:molecular chaperone GrpE
MTEENSLHKGEKNENQDQPETLSNEMENDAGPGQPMQISPEPEGDHKTEAEDNSDHKGKKKHKKPVEKEISTLSAEINELKDKYLRLYSEFENYRRRTSKEKFELIKTASEEVMIRLLPVIDDLERAISSMAESEKSSREGITLIYNKLKMVAENQGLKVMVIEKGTEFNSEFHEAITKIPVDDDALKGKIVDVLEKGYYLNDKVIRFAKVVTGS